MTLTLVLRSCVIGKPMFPRLHDHGLGFVRRLASDFCEFINSQIGQVVAGVNTTVRELPNQFSSDACKVTQIQRNLVNAFFMGDFHGQQRILRTAAQFVDGVFVETLDFEHFFQGHVSNLLQAGKTFGNQQICHFLVHIQLFHEQLAAGIVFACLLLLRLSGIQNVDFPAREV